MDVMEHLQRTVLLSNGTKDPLNNNNDTGQSHRNWCNGYNDQEKSTRNNEQREQYTVHLTPAQPSSIASHAPDLCVAGADLHRTRSARERVVSRGLKMIAVRKVNKTSLVANTAVVLGREERRLGRSHRGCVTSERGCARFSRSNIPTKGRVPLSVSDTITNNVFGNKIPPYHHLGKILFAEAVPKIDPG